MGYDACECLLCYLHYKSNNIQPYEQRGESFICGACLAYEFEQYGLDATQAHRVRQGLDLVLRSTDLVCVACCKSRRFGCMVADCGSHEDSDDE